MAINRKSYVLISVLILTGVSVGWTEVAFSMTPNRTNNSIGRGIRKVQPSSTKTSTLNKNSKSKKNTSIQQNKNNIKSTNNNIKNLDNTSLPRIQKNGNSELQLNNLKDNKQIVKVSNNLRQNNQALQAVPITSYKETQTLLSPAPVVQASGTQPLVQNPPISTYHQLPAVNINDLTKIQEQLETMKNNNNLMIAQLKNLTAKLETLTETSEKLDDIEEATNEVRESIEQIVEATNSGDDIDELLENGKKKLKNSKNKKLDGSENEINDINENNNDNELSLFNDESGSNKKKITLLTENDLKSIFELAKTSDEVKNNSKVSKLLDSATLSESDKSRIKSCIKLGQSLKNSKISEDDAVSQFSKILQNSKQNAGTIKNNDSKNYKINVKNDDYDVIDLDLESLDNEDAYKAIDEFFEDSDSNENISENKTNIKKDKKNTSRKKKSSNNGKCTIKLNVKQSNGNVIQTCAEELVDKTLKIIENEEEADNLDDLF